MPTLVVLSTTETEEMNRGGSDEQESNANNKVARITSGHAQFQTL